LQKQFSGKIPFRFNPEGVGWGGDGKNRSAILPDKKRFFQKEILNEIQ
jgi:hypothetical protein